MRVRGRVWVSTLVVLLVVLLAGTVTIPQARWRAQVVLLKARGRLPDISWPELVHMLMPWSGYYLKPLLETQNPYASIENPRHDSASVAAGNAVFRSRCAQCHSAGAGRSAPDLLHDPLRHGSSDWALYRTLARGIPGTGMVAQRMAEGQAWQTIAYIRSERARAAASHIAEGAPDRSTVPVVDGSVLNISENSAAWPTFSGTYSGRRYSGLSQITPANVSSLRLQWAFQLPGLGTVESEESSPLVAGNVMYVTGSPNHVWALDAQTGRVIWEYQRDLPDHLSLCCSEVNRGVALLGRRVYVGTLDGHLVALRARNGTVVWDVAVADPASGYSITSAPLAIGDRIITGVAGGEFGAPGFIAAYDTGTGRPLWHFQTIPAPGEPGHDTWGGDSWRTGGAPTWLTGSYDPKLQLLYWGVGNPGPNYSGGTRPGSNLYSNSVVALDVATGHLRWFFQFTPHDDHDWDAAQIPVLVDATVDGRPRHLLLWANRNGFYYVLDRETGAFLTGRPFEQLTWATGLDSAGHPVLRPGTAPTTEGTFLYPSVIGGTNWWPPAYSPKTGLLYVPTLHAGGTYYSDDILRRGDLFTAGASTVSTGQPYWTAIKALDPATGVLRWEYRLPPPPHVTLGGLAVTAGDIVFGGGGSHFVALDARTGRELWRVNAGAPIRAAPVVYATDGQERVAIMAGRVLMVFGVTPR